MRLHRFLVDQPLTEEKLQIIETDLLHQWSKVLRYVGGERVVLLDGKGTEVTGRLITCSSKQAEFEVETRAEETEPEVPKLTLYFSPLKRDLTELVFQKGTELGVSVFQPILCERTVRDGFKPDRAVRILKEATEQSGRRWLPVCQAPISFQEALKSEKAKTEVFFASLVTATTQRAVKNTSPSARALFVGPEGGWTENEEQLAIKAGFMPLRLSKHVLRAETACIAGVALLQAQSLV